MQNIVSIMTIIILVASKIIPSVNKLGNALTSISNVGPWIITLDEIIKSSEEFKEKQISKERKRIKWSKLQFEKVDFKYSNNSLT